MQVIRRIGLIGDVHAEHDALRFVIDELARLGAETLLQVGDIADGAGDLDATIELLEQHRVLAVRGNHDRWLLNGQARELPLATPVAAVSAASRHYLSQLPITRELRSARGDVLLCHGLGKNDMVGVKPDTGRLRHRVQHRAAKLDRRAPLPLRAQRAHAPSHAEDLRILVDHQCRHTAP